MKIHVGSRNPTKIQAVKNAVLLYPQIFPDPKVQGIEVNIELYGHPKTLSESVQGAIDRAKQAFTTSTFSFGLEGGLMHVPHTKTGFMEVGACAIYNGKSIYLGLGPAYEWPLQVTKMIVSGQADASQAFHQLGYTNHAKMGAIKGGIIGHLTNNRMSREDFTKYSIIMAMIQLEQPQYYTQIPYQQNP